MPGKGIIKQTGKLGDVMKESIDTAFSVVRSHASSLGISPDVFEKTDIHVHVPEGATPKDTISAKESIFLPKPNLSSRSSFLETHPSTESKTTATSMHNDAYDK